MMKTARQIEMENGFMECLDRLDKEIPDLRKRLFGVTDLSAALTHYGLTSFGLSLICASNLLHKWVRECPKREQVTLKASLVSPLDRIADSLERIAELMEPGSEHEEYLAAQSEPEVCKRCGGTGLIDAIDEADYGITFPCRIPCPKCQKPEVCEWEKCDGVYIPSCEHSWPFAVIPNRLCPFCGRPIREVQKEAKEMDAKNEQIKWARAHAQMTLEAACVQFDCIVPEDSMGCPECPIAILRKACEQILNETEADHG